MNHSSDRNDSAAAEAARELARLRRRIVDARAQLADLQRQVKETQALRDDGGAVFHDEPPAGEIDPPAPDVESKRQLLDRHAQALSQHKRQRAQQQEANEQLVLAALDAQDLQMAAEQAQRRQSEFLAVLAHELRNPLGPLRTAASLLGGTGSKETLLPRLQEIIERQVVHMSRLIGDLLDISRANTGKLRLEREIVDMGGIIGQAVDTCRPAIDARRQQLDVTRPTHALEVCGDPVRLAQVLGNLLDNACKYTPEGGSIGLAAVVRDDSLVITVSDNGIGITAEGLSHVFEPFVQEPHATGFSGLGLGIGLTVVRELIEAHGGTVTVASDGSGLGSQFVVTLPMADGR